MLKPPMKPQSAQRIPRTALVDVSNRDQLAQPAPNVALPDAYSKPAATMPASMPPPPRRSTAVVELGPTTTTAAHGVTYLPARSSYMAASYTASKESKTPTEPASRMSLPPPVVPATASSTAPARTDLPTAQDVSMTMDTSHPSGLTDVTPDDLPVSQSSASLRSDDTEALADIELDLDPQGIVTLTLEEELVEQRRVMDICDKYEMSVLVPQALAAQAVRQSLVRQGQMDAQAAAHDDEMMRLGLDTEEARDLSMVAEYTQEIFDYMACLERESMANPNYMDFQDEIQWHMRATLIDWLLQVHMRYHMLPETLWIAVNLVDRFLSARIVSLAKLQLVGVTAMFIAAKYEEILAPSVEEFVFMTDGGYSREEILKGERIVLSTLEFNVSTYCSPYSWVRRISKADDYDIQTRTLCKCLMEVTLLNHLFLRIRPSMVAAIGMYVSKRMLGGVWDDAFVYYSRFTETQLLPGANILLEKLMEPGFEEQFVYKKYASKKFLKASIYARNWALRHRTLHPAPSDPAL
ncbi:b-type cyclin 2 [Malassezia pachydermatis]|uniref:B-type cyclin 2 n=1 Tax=Malassezia pachydermatis TaxID=77020 RepID=A0A0M8MNE2_9BASI|nr:b-type cyclin 2 [Malassezia pachydermatis]KOS15996.1 b-type cyclin 2 [Malassezia pachydermatis]